MNEIKMKKKIKNERTFNLERQSIQKIKQSICYYFASITDLECLISIFLFFFNSLLAGN